MNAGARSRGLPPSDSPGDARPGKLARRPEVTRRSTGDKVNPTHPLALKETSPLRVLKNRKMLGSFEIPLSPVAIILYPAGIVQQHTGNGHGSSGWVTTRQAASALRLQPRQVRNLIAGGELEAKTEGEGVNRRYLVSISSLETLRQKRQEEGSLPEQYPDAAEGTAMSGHSGQDAGAIARDLAASLAEAHYELGKAQARLELTAETESTTRETLTRERERADRLEAELLAMYKAPPEPREPPEALSKDLSKGEEVSASQEPVSRRSWLIRFFFGP